jgi:hypothetical protein
MTREEIYEAARTFLDIPWRHRGRSRMGVDCIGLVCQLGDHFGIPYEDIDGYSRNPDGRFVDHVRKFMIYREPQVVAPGCAVILRDQHQPCHIGVISQKWGALYMVHASLAKRRVIEEEWDGFWSSRFRCALDFPGVED